MWLKTFVRTALHWKPELAWSCAIIPCLRTTLVSLPSLGMSRPRLQLVSSHTCTGMPHVLNQPKAPSRAALLPPAAS